MDRNQINLAASLIKKANRVVAFTGAGISVESGIPPFRGLNGIWSRYDPHILEIEHFLSHPEASWELIKEIFYDYFNNAKPNPAHIALAEMEKNNLLHSIITQNIDNLHQDAGSKIVIEYHGSSRRLICMDCRTVIPFNKDVLDNLPPRCTQCNGLLKPDFIFFGEPIPISAVQMSTVETQIADLWLLIGTTGEVYPACSLPLQAKQNGKYLIEINIKPSSFTHSITDIFLKGKASEVTQALFNELLI